MHLLSLVVEILSYCNFSLVQGNFAIPFQLPPVHEMATPLEIKENTDEQVIVQGDVTFMKKMVESLVMEFDQEKYEEFLSSGSKSHRVAQQYRKVSSEICSQVFQRLPRRWPAQRASFLAASHVRLASMSPMKPERPASSKINPASPFLFLSFKLPGVSNNP